jgi:DNA invertase Pin-like site-specific DNA recombinase
MVTQAYGYTRVSGLGQVNGHGPQRQRELISEFAAKAGIEVVKFFEDAHTGTEADRPAFVEMLAAMMANGVKTVIVESLDRFARDLLIQSTLLAKLASEGLTLVAANTGEDVTAAMLEDPMRKAMVQIQGVFAELDKSLTVRKLRKAREAKRAETGRCEGKKPYGEHDGEREVLARVHRLRRKARLGPRMPLSQVAERLNAEGYTNRSGQPWTPANLRKVLRLRGQQ